MTDTPLIDANPTHYLKRIDRDTPPLQFIRELVQNGIEAGATEIKLKPRQWIYKKDEEVNYTYKMMIEDNGEGMTPQAMYDHLAKLNSSSKASNSDFHENFGIGAKITTTMWNPHGVVFLSWHKDNPDKGHMVWLRYNEDYGQVCLKSFSHIVVDEDGYEVEEPIRTLINGSYENIIPLLDEEGDPYPLGDMVGSDLNSWNNLRPESGHGTVVILLGDEPSTFTWTDSNRNQLSDRDLKFYLNTRYSELPENLKVSVYTQDDSWRLSKVFGFYDALEEMENYVQAREIVACPNGFEVEVIITKDHTQWRKDYKIKNNHSLTSGESFSKSHFRKEDFKKGFVALEYQTEHTRELYNIEKGIRALSSWGISANQVAPRVKLIVRPPLADDKKKTDGVYPNEGRYRLQWREYNSNRDNNEIDLVEVQDFFVNNHPQSLTDLIEEAYKGYKAKSVDLDKVVDRWKDLFKPKKSHLRSVVADDEGELMFNPSPRAKPKEKGTNPKVGSDETRSKTGHENPDGKLKGKLRKSKQEMEIESYWIPYIKGSENNITDSFEESGYVYPAYVEIRNNKWQLYLMKNHPYFTELCSFFMDKKRTLTLDVVEEVCKAQHEAFFGAYLRHLNNIKVQDMKSYYSKVALHSRVIGTYELWDRITTSLGKIGK